MVNTKIVSRFTGPIPPEGDGAARKIAGGPLYEHETVLEILALGESVVVPWTRKCASDLKKYELDLNDVVAIIRLALSEGRFIGSEWCVNQPGGAWAACDSYSLKRREWLESARKHMDIEYYIKFAIGKTGKVILTASCHLSEDRW